MSRLGLLRAMFALACVPSAALAGFNVNVLASSTQQSNGTYLYSYTLSNLGSSTLSVSEFDLAINDPIGLTSIVSPSDFFTFYNAGDTTITFDSYDDGIAPGSTSVFSFISGSAPGLASALVRGTDSSFNNVDNSIMLLAPAVVPEPSSLLMCACGALAPLGLVARSRWRRAA